MMDFNENMNFNENDGYGYYNEGSREPEYQPDHLKSCV